MKIKKGDLIRVLSGKDKGTEGHVMAVNSESGRITVEGVHTGRKHQPPTQTNDQGGIIDIALTIDASNVAVVCPKRAKPDALDIGSKVTPKCDTTKNQGRNCRERDTDGTPHESSLSRNSSRSTAKSARS